MLEKESGGSEQPDQDVLVAPYGGRLVDLSPELGQAEDLRRYASALPSLQLSARALCDLELLSTGAFSPLDRFMGEKDHWRVIREMRLSSGILFPIPIALPVGADTARTLRGEVCLRDPKNNPVAVLKVEEVYEWNRTEVARRVLGTTDSAHPLVAEMERWGRYNVSGPIRLIEIPRHYDFQELRLTPAETRSRLKTIGRRDVVAFQTRNPLHRAHEELTRRAAEAVDGVLLLHPVVGITRPGDIDHFTRVRTYRVLADRYFAPDRILLALLPLAMRMAGPREAVWHALIRRNYGANHLIVGRDHASPGRDSAGKPFYGPYDAQEVVARHQDELGVRMIPFKELVYIEDEDRYEEVTRIPENKTTFSISGTEVRDEYLNRGKHLPPWFTRPETAAILAEAYPPRHRQGVCIWFTGLSGAGKSTTAEVLTLLLLEHGRQVTLLDGDIVRNHLSKGLGFTREDRDANILRIGFVASEVVRHGGVAICAAVSPYRNTRDEVRRLMPESQFLEIFVDTPLPVCESRDIKGMYAKARRGEIKGFTGIDDPYEEPLSPEVRLDTVDHSPEKNARMILDRLKENGFVA